MVARLKGGIGTCLVLVLVVTVLGINLSFFGRSRQSAVRLRQDAIQIAKIAKEIEDLKAEIRAMRGGHNDTAASQGGQTGAPGLSTELQGGPPKEAKSTMKDAEKAKRSEPEKGTNKLDGESAAQPEYKVPVSARIPLPNGMQNGSCVEVPLVYNGGGKFQIELRGGGNPDDVRCTYSNKDIIHMHARLGNPSNDVGYSGAMTHWKPWGSEFSHRMKGLQFKDETIGKVGKPITTRICAEHEWYTLHQNGKFSIRVQWWWDPADIRCLHISGFERVSANGDVALSGMPSVPARRDCIFSRCTKTVPPPEPFHAIDYGLFINLDHRNDRRVAMEKTLRDANITHYRIPGFNTKDHPELLKGCWDEATGAKVCGGQLGCQRWHLAAIEKAMADKRPYAAIFEDDFRWHSWVDPSKVGAMVTELMQKYPDWDAIGLSLNIGYEEEIGRLELPCKDNVKCQVMRVFEAQAPSGYILRDTIYKQVHHRFSKGYCNVHVSYAMMTDYCWKVLQHYFKFYAFEPQLGTQQASFSDIEKRDVNYNNLLSL